MSLKNVEDRTIDEQGERMVPAFHRGQLVYGEHISRYESIQGLLKDKIVLDIASGSGYGTYLLSDKAKKVYGVDIETEALEYAKRNYAKENIEYILGSAENIPLPDSSIDVLVTFETIEHVKDYKTFMREIKRVLKKDGYAIISTPNDPEFPEGNHFHLHEFEEDELKELLTKTFNNVEMYYQYTWITAAIIDEEKARKNMTNLVNVSNVAPVGKEKALYFIAICSDKNIDGLKPKEGIYLSEHYSARKILEDELAKRSYVKYLESELRRWNKKYLKSVDELNNVYSSKSWKLVSKVRAAKHKVTKNFTKNIFCIFTKCIKLKVLR